MPPTSSRKRRIAWGCALAAVVVTAVGIPLVRAVRQARMAAQAMTSR